MKYFLFLFALSFAIQGNAQTLTSGGQLKPEQAIMDVRRYTIALDVDIAGKSISGYTRIDVNMLAPTNVLLFDLLDSFTIKKVEVNAMVQSYTYVHNLVTIHLAKQLGPGKAVVKITYNGKPHIALNPPWGDGFTFTKDSSGHPWVAVTAEGTGGKIYYPCKDHPSDEPNEGAELIITVPKGMVVAGPGLLKKRTTNKDKVTYDWNTDYTINNYSIVFNIGNYKVAEGMYTTINGNHVPMQFFVLPEDEKYAQHHLEVLEQVAHTREKYFGEYPWAKEKIGIVETPHLGMEHQTMNAYGNHFRYNKIGGKDYDELMSHEFGHEWWGNKVTVKDWADYWIHEGIETFADALDIRDMENEDAYNKHFQQQALYFRNTLPIVLGKDIDEESAYNGDIYGKGAFFMHTLRFVMGDSIFFPALKEFATGPEYTYSNLVTTANLESLFNARYGKDLKPLFDLFLRTTGKLEISVKRVPDQSRPKSNDPDKTYKIALLNMDMNLPLVIHTSHGMQTVTANKKGLIIRSANPPVIDPDMYYLTRTVFE